jgi:hypothetical protein
VTASEKGLNGTGEQRVSSVVVLMRGFYIKLALLQTINVLGTRHIT